MGRRQGGTQAPNPISAAVSAWLSSLPSPLLGEEEADQTRDQLCNALVDAAPKRWVVYEPMVLLPSGAFAARPWETLLRSLDDRQVEALWASILVEVSRQSREELTHLAANEGIPARVADEDEGDRVAARAAPAADGAENVLRSPTGLRMLYGDFGPDVSFDGTDEPSVVAARDFKAAFWVSVKQNGIWQTWAPRWTMFSRGNIKEKARLLAFHDHGNSPQMAEESSSLGYRARPKTSLAGKWAVDLYAGIGYFGFSYAKLGFKVICWELNPWSVEGLRRGAEANGWSVRVVNGYDLDLATPDLVTGDYQIVVFLEDNQSAARRIDELRGSPSAPALDITHVNCGLLPSSAPTWASAWSILGPTREGWLHLHENVSVAEIESRRGEIQKGFETLSRNAGAKRTAVVEHVERVKTFAPGVWHCVFDVYIAAPAESDADGL